MGGLFCYVLFCFLEVARSHRLGGGNGCELCAISKANLGA
jgi:hypothetical protein